MPVMAKSNPPNHLVFEIFATDISAQGGSDLETFAKGFGIDLWEVVYSLPKDRILHAKSISNF